MDGVMVDTEPLHLQGNNLVLGQYGHEETAEMRQKFIGVPDTEWLMLIDMFNLPATADELIEQKRKVYRKILAKNIVAMPGLFELLEDLKKAFPQRKL